MKTTPDCKRHKWEVVEKKYGTTIKMCVTCGKRKYEKSTTKNR